jgi:hypothetical protein
LTPKRKQQLLERLETGETVLSIAKAFGMSRQALYARKKLDPVLAEAWDEAAYLGARARLDDLEREADRRAIDGVLRQVYYRGNIIGTIRDYSDRLLIFRIKAEAKRASDDSYIHRSNSEPKAESALSGVITL